MSAAEVIERIKELPANERAQVAKFVMEHDDSWVPESFKEGMKAAREKAALWTWRPRCIKHRRRTCDEISLPGGRAVLDSFLPTGRRSKRGHAQGLENFQGKPIRPAIANAQSREAASEISRGQRPR